MSFARSLVVPALLVVATAASAQTPPERLTFTGRLVRTDGQPESGQHQLRFVLYDQAAGGQNLWEETQTVTVSNGYYTVELGAVATTPLSTVFTGPVRYLGVSLDQESEMQPRIALLSAPYALRSSISVKALNADQATNATNAANATNAMSAQHANNADQATTAADASLLDGMDSTAFAPVNHTHPAATTTANGFMSSADKTKLNSVPTTWGNGLAQNGSTVDVEYAGSGGNFGTATTVARSDHTHPQRSLVCSTVTATAAFDAGATASCTGTDVLTGGGCTGIPTGSGFDVTAAPTSTGYVCKGNGSSVPSTAVTATAICCKLQ